MEVEQIVLVVGLIAVVLIDRSNQSLLAKVPEQERIVLEELLGPLRIPLALFAGVLVAELARIAIGANSTTFRLLPPLVGLLAATVGFFIRRRAFMIYDLSAGDSDVGRIQRARTLTRRAGWSLLASVALWTGICAYRL